MLELVKDLVDQLDSQNVCYVHFKSNEHIDQSVNGDTDFDILVDRSCANDFERVLRELEFKRFVSPVRAAYPGVDDWIGMDWTTGKFIHLHTHYQLVTGKSGYKNYVLPWADIAMESREKDDETGLFMVSPEFELVELYSRIVAKMARRKDRRAMRSGYTLQGDNLKEAKWLWERVEREKLENTKEQCFGKAGLLLDTGLLFKEKLSAEEYSDFRKVVLDKLSCHERAGMKHVDFHSWVHSWRTRINRKRKKYFFLPDIQQKKFCHTGGLLIAFLGVDGSGKTTVTGEIRSWLNWKLETSHMSLGVGREKQSLLAKAKRKVKKLLGRSTAPYLSAGLTSEAPVEITRHNTRVQKKKLRFAKKVSRDIRRIHSYCLNGGIMVVDRYPQTQFAGIADGPKVNAAYPEMQEKELEYLSIIDEIQPDIVFKLMVPVEVSQERRPEDAREVLEKKYEILQQVTYPKSTVIEVDATQPLDQELLFIKRKIWENL